MVTSGILASIPNAVQIEACVDKSIQVWFGLAVVVLAGAHLSVVEVKSI